MSVWAYSILCITYVKIDTDVLYLLTDSVQYLLTEQYILMYSTYTSTVYTKVLHSDDELIILVQQLIVLI